MRYAGRFSLRTASFLALSHGICSPIRQLSAMHVSESALYEIDFRLNLKERTTKTR